MDQLTSSQISEWEAYDRLDPIGTWREDYNTAALLAMIANIMRGNNDEVKTPLDFMPNWGKEKVKAKMIKQEELVDKIKSVFGTIAAQNKRIGGLKPPVKRRK